MESNLENNQALTIEDELQATDLQEISGGTSKHHHDGSLVETGDVLSNNDENNTAVNVLGVQVPLQDSPVDLNVL